MELNYHIAVKRGMVRGMCTSTSDAPDRNVPLCPFCTGTGGGGGSTNDVATLCSPDFFLFPEESTVSLQKYTVMLPHFSWTVHFSHKLKNKREASQHEVENGVLG